MKFLMLENANAINKNLAKIEAYYERCTIIVKQRNAPPRREINRARHEGAWTT